MGGEGGESVAKKRKRQKVDPSTDEVREETNHMEEREGEVKKSKRRKKNKMERSPAADEDALSPENVENLDPVEKKKKKKKGKEREVGDESSAPTLGVEDELENLKKTAEGTTEEENSGAELKKSKKKKKDSVAETNDEYMDSMDTLSEGQVVCESLAECDEEKEAVEDSGCEEVAEVKVKKTKKSKKEKTKF